MSAATDALTALRSAVDALLAAPDAFDGDDELHAFVIGAQVEQHRLVAAVAPAVARWDSLRLWADDGTLSAASRLSAEAHTSKAAARCMLRRAKQLQEMPITAAALAEGSLSPDHVDLFGRANRSQRRERFAQDEETLVSACKPLLFDDAIRAVAYWRNRADADGSGDAEAVRRRDRAADAHLHASETLDGNTVINGLLDPIAGEIFRNELDRLEHILYLADKESGSDRTNAQRRAAALVEMATRSAAMPDNARRPKPLFVVHVGDETARRLCELAAGTVLQADELARWLDDALMEAFLFDGPSVLLTASQKRTFTGKLRSAIQARDRRCQHPSGCRTPAPKGDVDHIIPWAEGGRTDQFNARVGCQPHNRNHTKRDRDPQPHPQQPVDRLAALRAKCRWVYRRECERNGDDSDGSGSR